MSRFIEVLGRITGKRVEVHDTSLFRKLVDLGPIKYVKGKPLSFFSTMDLNQDGTLKANYLAERKKRRRGEKKENECAGVPDVSIYDIWGI